MSQQLTLGPQHPRPDQIPWVGPKTLLEAKPTAVNEAVYKHDDRDGYQVWVSTEGRGHVSNLVPEPVPTANILTVFVPHVSAYTLPVGVSDAQIQL